jgi:hypothetical protein
MLEVHVLISSVDAMMIKIKTYLMGSFSDFWEPHVCVGIVERCYPLIV